MASSSAQRLKPHAIDIRVNIDPLHRLLSPPRDTRSSLYLEDAATEIQVQGLELDWTIVTWDADLRWRGSDWSFHSFHGAKWTGRGVRVFMRDFTITRQAWAWRRFKRAKVKLLFIQPCLRARLP